VATEEILAERVAYYRARASEYDDWWCRRGYRRPAGRNDGGSGEISRLGAIGDGTRRIATARSS
jgi:hypothetical protein